MVYCGIDLHSDNRVIITLNNNNKIVKEAKPASSRRVLDDFFSARLRSLFWCFLGCLIDKHA
jgi:hypothetical protein